MVCVTLLYKIPISFKTFSEAQRTIQYHAVWTAHNMILISYILSWLPVCISHCTSDFNISFSGGGNEMNIGATKFVKIFDCEGRWIHVKSILISWISYWLGKLNALLIYCFVNLKPTKQLASDWYVYKCIELSITK